MPGDDEINSGLQLVSFETAKKFIGRNDVIDGRGVAQLVQEPEALLKRRCRRRLQLASVDGRNALACFQKACDSARCWILEERPDCKDDAGSLGKPIDYLKHQE
jgi:hypothetical protein